MGIAYKGYMNIAIVHATPDDLKALSALARETFLATFTHYDDRSEVERHLEDICSEAYFSVMLARGDVLLLARDGEALVGYAKAGQLDLPVENPDPSHGEIHRLYVAPSHHGAGVGRLLMDAMLAALAARDAATVYLGVWEHNLRAQRFYTRYGFTPVGGYVYPVGRYRDNEIIMARRRND